MTAPSEDMNRVTRAFINVRDARSALKKQFEDADADLKDVQLKIEGAMLNHLNTHGIGSVKTEAGTFYSQEEIMPSCQDWSAFYDWIKEHDAFDALERRVKKTFVKEFADTHDGNLPPGVSIVREKVVRVRRT